MCSGIQFPRLLFCSLFCPGQHPRRQIACKGFVLSPGPFVYWGRILSRCTTRYCGLSCWRVGPVFQSIHRLASPASMHFSLFTLPAVSQLSSRLHSRTLSNRQINQCRLPTTPSHDQKLQISRFTRIRMMGAIMEGAGALRWWVIDSWEHWLS